jgi:hypothetical protein
LFHEGRVRVPAKNKGLDAEGAKESAKAAEECGGTIEGDGGD